MSAELIDWEDSVALATIARSAGITLAQARIVLLGIVAMPEEQGARVIASARAAKVRAINAQTRREDEAETARRRARGEIA